MEVSFLYAASLAGLLLLCSFCLKMWDLCSSFLQGDTKGSAKGTDASAKKDGLQQQLPTSQVFCGRMISAIFGLSDSIYIMELDFNVLVL